jgi:hypothetical protein
MGSPYGHGVPLLAIVELDGEQRLEEVAADRRCRAEAEALTRAPVRRLDQA